MNSQQCRILNKSHAVRAGRSTGLTKTMGRDRAMKFLEKQSPAGLRMVRVRLGLGYRQLSQNVGCEGDG